MRQESLRSWNLTNSTLVKKSREGYESIFLTIANFMLKLVAGSSTFFVAERNAQNSAADELPPVLPLDLYGIASRELVSASLQQQKLQLRQKSTN